MTAIVGHDNLLTLQNMFFVFAHVLSFSIYMYDESLMESFAVEGLIQGADAPSV